MHKMVHGVTCEQKFMEVEPGTTENLLWLGPAQIEPLQLGTVQ